MVVAGRFKENKCKMNNSTLGVFTVARWLYGDVAETIKKKR